MRLVKPLTHIMWFAAAITIAACSNDAPSSEAATESSTTSQVTQPVPTASDAVAPVEMSDAQLLTKGRRVFLKCSSCHSLDQEGAHKVGPALWGFYGESAASREGYTYSEALQNADIVWNDTTLGQYLEAPARYVPGTKMAYVGLRNAQDRAAVIAYLKAETEVTP